MLKIHDTKERTVSEVRQAHYDGLKGILLRRITKAKLSSLVRNELKSELEVILTGRPPVLLKAEKRIQKAIGKSASTQATKEKLRKVFNYKVFTQKSPETDWNPYKLLSGLKVNTCVYCNRQYTFTVQDNGQKVTRPQFDHFFPKDKHPILALSFYNLIPCCSICNGIKANKSMSLDKYLHPYEDEFGNTGFFTYLPQDYRAMVGSSANMTVKILTDVTSVQKHKVVNQNELFRLDKIYNEHSDHIQEILWKGRNAQGPYLEWFQQLFDAKLSKEDLYRYALGNYSDDLELDKRVLAKLTRDVAREIGIV